MKFFTLFAGTFITVAMSLNAQTINSNWVSSPGTNHVNRYVSLSGTIDPGPAGSGQNWNFGSLVSDSLNTEFVVPPANAAGNSNFPTATVAFVTNEGPASFSAFYTVDANAWTNIGAYLSSTDGNILVNYSNPMDVLRFPASLNSTFTDNFAMSFTAGPLSYSRTGTNVTVMDAAGTLITPVGTFSNVLRMMSVQTYVDDFGIPLPPPAGEGSTTVYNWISSDYPGAVLLSISIDETSTTSDTSVTYVNPTEVGFEQIASSTIGVFPNPASDQVRVILTADMNVSRLELMDLSGRIVTVQTVASNQLQALVSTSALDNGVYILRAVNSNGNSTSTRLVVAH
jgi:hypothetical protein